MLGNLNGLTFMNSLVMGISEDIVNHNFNKINIKENNDILRDIKIELEMTKQNVNKLKEIKFKNKLTRDVAELIVNRQELLSKYLNVNEDLNSDKITLLNTDIQYILNCDCSRINVIVSNKMEDTYSQVKFKDLIEKDYNTINYIQKEKGISYDLKELDEVELSKNLYGSRLIEGQEILYRPIKRIELERVIKEFEDNGIYGLTLFQKEICDYISEKLLTNNNSETAMSIDKKCDSYIYLSSLISELYDATQDLGSDL